jgi:hypothetical protein
VFFMVKKDLDTLGSCNRQLKDKVQFYADRGEWKNARNPAERLQKNVYRSGTPSEKKMADAIYANIKGERDPFYSRTVNYASVIIIGVVLGLLFFFNNITGNVIGDPKGSASVMSVFVFVCLGVVLYFFLVKKR